MPRHGFTTHAIMVLGSLGHGRLPSVPVYGVPFHLFRQTPSSRQMQSPPHWLEHRPPMPPILTTDDVVVDDALVEVVLVTLVVALGGVS